MQAGKSLVRPGGQEHAAHEPLISSGTVADVPLAGLTLTFAKSRMQKKKQPYPPRLRRIRLFKYPHGESNPGFRTENPTSWATRRWGRVHLVLALSTGESSRLERRASRSD